MAVPAVNLPVVYEHSHCVSGQVRNTNPFLSHSHAHLEVQQQQLPLVTFNEIV